MMFIFLFDIRKSYMNLITSSINMTRYLFPSNDAIYIDLYILKWISILFSACLLLMNEKSDLCIFFIIQSIYTFISWIFYFGFSRIFNLSTFPLIASVIMIELAAWLYFSCHMHNFASHFSITIWAAIVTLYWSTEMKYNSFIIFISIWTFSFMNIMKLFDISMSKSYSILIYVNDNNSLQSCEICNISCIIMKLSYLFDNLTFSHSAIFNIEISIFITFFELLMTKW